MALQAALFAVCFYLFVFLCYYITCDFYAEMVEEDAVWQTIIEVFSALLIFVHYRVLVGGFLPNKVTASHIRACYEDSDRFELRLKKVLCDILFWMWLLPIVFGAIVLPVSVGFEPLVNLLSAAFQPSALVGKIIVLTIFLPAFFLILLWCYVKTIKRTLEDSHASGVQIRKSAQQLNKLRVFGFLTLIGVALLGPIALMILVSLWNISFALIPVIAAVIVFLFLIRYIRAIRIRKKLIKQLKQLAEKRHCRISDIRSPYRSLFFKVDGIHFTLHANGKTYACRFIAAVNRRKHIYLYEDGTGYYIRRYRLPLFMPVVRTRVGARVVDVRDQGELFHTKKAFRYGFDSKDQKILLISPVPQDIFAVQNDQTISLNMGDRVGEYTVYNASTLISRIESDTLHKS